MFMCHSYNFEINNVVISVYKEHLPSKDDVVLVDDVVFYHILPICYLVYCDEMLS